MGLRTIIYIRNDFAHDIERAPVEAWHRIKSFLDTGNAKTALAIGARAGIEAGEPGLSSQAIELVTNHLHHTEVEYFRADGSGVKRQRVYERTTVQTLNGPRQAVVLIEDEE